MMSQEWLDTMLDGDYQADLVRIAFEGGDGVRCEGQGRIAWTRDAGVRLDALTNGTDCVLKHILSRNTPGKLLGDEYYMRVSARTADDWALSIERVDPENCEIRTEKGTVVWTIDQSQINSQVILTESGTSTRTAITEFLLAPFECSRWPRASEFSYDNPWFGWRREKLDWLEFATSVGKVGACQWRNDVLKIKIRHTQPDGDRERELNAIRMAFNLLHGRTSNILASETTGGGETVRRFRLPSARQRDTRFFAPLGWPSRLPRCFEPLLSKAVDCFITESGGEIADYVYACHDSRDNTMSTHVMVLCATLEALIREVDEGRGETVALTGQQKDKLRTFLAQELNLDEKSVDRIMGLLSMLGQKPPQTTMKEWTQSGFLGIEKADTDAWLYLRRPVMHGELMRWRDADETQRQFDALRRVTNVTNKLLLHLIGYQGDYFDWVTYHERSFPAAQ
jgi:hypothetical protein